MDPTPTIECSPGRPLPLGCSVDSGGVNLAVFSRNAQRLDVLLFDPGKSNDTPLLTVPLGSPCHRTGDIWHARLEGVPQGCSYAFRAHGPYVPAEGHRFNSSKLLLDPCAVALIGTDCWDFSCACGDAPAGVDMMSTVSDAGMKPTCHIPNTAPFDWEDDCRLARPWSEMIIYETHVRGLTVHRSAAVTQPGTFLALIEKIPYFKRLGVTALELLPVQEFFENELTRHDPTTGSRLKNYWGYSTVAFFAPKESYSSRRSAGCQIEEFKMMVRALHKAGIEVILDVVFNHTAEGDHTGPTINYRGLDNSIYYLLDEDRRHYRNYSGCGNTLNCSHPVVRDHVLDCLRYWVVEMHVDGFRFDLASVLGRGANGEVLADPPLLERIAEDPVLRDVKLIAEAWDAGGAYQVGNFAGQRWSEWNGHYRDDVRRFWRGDAGMTGAFAGRLCGSADIYARASKTPVNSINFITCHDGFTMNDLVSYRAKHNESNGVRNDGSDVNFSDNYGVEGDTTDPVIERIRVRQIKNFLATLFLSRGVPMMLGGDEFRRTQKGNNNGYCQDNETSWYDWHLVDANREIFEFTVRMIAFRKQHEVLTRQLFYGAEELIWFDEEGNMPNWGGGASALGCAIRPVDGAPSLCLLFNPTPAIARFTALEKLLRWRWSVAIDTALVANEPVADAPGTEASWVLLERSLRVLVGTQNVASGLLVGSVHAIARH